MKPNLPKSYANLSFEQNIHSFPNEVNNTEAMEGIYRAFKEWESQSCLQFVKRTIEPDYVELFGSGKG